MWSGGMRRVYRGRCVLHNTVLGCRRSGETWWARFESSGFDDSRTSMWKIGRIVLSQRIKGLLLRWKIFITMLNFGKDWWHIRKYIWLQVPPNLIHITSRDDLYSHLLLYMDGEFVQTGLLPPRHLITIFILCSWTLESHFLISPYSALRCPSPFRENNNNCVACETSHKERESEVCLKNQWKEALMNRNRISAGDGNLERG